MKKSSIITKLLIGISAAIGLVIILSISTHTNTSGAFHYGSTSLVGASPEQVGKFAQEYVEAQHGTSRSNSQVLLARPITPNELPGLELGCPLSFAAIEEPPLMLVILEGEFNLSMPGTIGTGIRASYLAYIFDLWSAKPVYLRASKTGGVFRKALNDATLPIEADAVPGVCPTQLPYPKTLHYGDTAPGLIPPTVAPDEIATITPILPIPSPNATAEGE